jgi:hypothetical protein
MTLLSRLRAALTVEDILSAETALLRLERSAVLHGASRVALLAALTSNAVKAQAVFRSMSEASDQLSPWSLAIGLELALGVASYALADRLQANRGRKKTERRPAAVLWVVVVVFSLISAAANVVYFKTNGGALWRAVTFGIAAPLVALSNAFLTGDVAGAEHAREEALHEAQVALEKKALEVEEAKAIASGKRAEARKAQAEAGQGVRGKPPALAPTVPAERPVARLDDFRRILAGLDGDWSHLKELPGRPNADDVARVVAAADYDLPSRRTQQNWAAMERDGG